MWSILNTQISSVGMRNAERSRLLLRLDIYKSMKIRFNTEFQIIRRMFKNFAQSNKQFEGRMKRERNLSSAGIGIAFPCSHHNFLGLTKAADREVYLHTLSHGT